MNLDITSTTIFVHNIRATNGYVLIALHGLEQEGKQIFVSAVNALAKWYKNFTM